MTFLSMRELRSNTKDLKEMLSKGSVVVTNNGKPAAVMVDVSEDDFEETVIDLCRVRAKHALRKIRASAQESGASEMTLDEINAVIAETRRERKLRNNEI
jgi:prevent-host-death family protein